MLEGRKQTLSTQKGASTQVGELHTTLRTYIPKALCVSKVESTSAPIHPFL